MSPKKKVRRSIFKVLTGVIVGGAIGSILGLTLAPRKGTDTRKAIRDRSLEMFLKGKAQLRREHEMGSFKKTVIKLLTRKRKNRTKEPTES